MHAHVGCAPGVPLSIATLLLLDLSTTVVSDHPRAAVGTHRSCLWVCLCSASILVANYCKASMLLIIKLVFFVQVDRHGWNVFDIDGSSRGVTGLSMDKLSGFQGRLTVNLQRSLLTEGNEPQVSAVKEGMASEGDAASCSSSPVAMHQPGRSLTLFSLEQLPLHLPGTRIGDFHAIPWVARESGVRDSVQ